jgi:hypothetical protein
MAALVHDSYEAYTTEANSDLVLTMGRMVRTCIRHVYGLGDNIYGHLDVMIQPLLARVLCLEKETLLLGNIAELHEAVMHRSSPSAWELSVIAAIVLTRWRASAQALCEKVVELREIDELRPCCDEFLTAYAMIEPSIDRACVGLLSEAEDFNPSITLEDTELIRLVSYTASSMNPQVHSSF